MIILVLNCNAYFFLLLLVSCDSHLENRRDGFYWKDITKLMSKIDQRLYINLWKNMPKTSICGPLCSKILNSSSISYKNNNTCSSYQLGLPSNPDSAVVGASNFCSCSCTLRLHGTNFVWVFNLILHAVPKPLAATPLPPPNPLPLLPAM